MFDTFEFEDEPEPPTSFDEVVPTSGIKELEKEIDKNFHSMEDNTQINNDEKQLRFAKLNMPAELVDFLMDHYGFFDLVELNTLSFYVMKALAMIEKDGFKLVIHRIVDEKVEAYELNIHDIIAKVRINLAQAMSKEKNEKNSV